MAKRQKEWARRKRAELLERLGGKCKICGTDKELEFDCIIPQGEAHHRFDTSHRISFYLRQLYVGNLQILCHDCNAKKGRRERKDQQFLTVSVPDFIPQFEDCPF